MPVEGGEATERQVQVQVQVGIYDGSDVSQAVNSMSLHEGLLVC